MNIVNPQLMLDAAKWAGEHEACGVVVRGGLAIVLPNVSRDTREFFMMDVADLTRVYDAYGDFEAAWHSHPGGTVDPSPSDLEHHPPGLRLLIVANGEIHDHGLVNG